MPHGTAEFPRRLRRRIPSAAYERGPRFRPHSGTACDRERVSAPFLLLVAALQLLSPSAADVERACPTSTESVISEDVGSPPGCAFSGGGLICGGVKPTPVPSPQRVRSADPSPASGSAPSESPARTARPPEKRPTDRTGRDDPPISGFPLALTIGLSAVVVTAGATLYLWDRGEHG